ncbi:MAG: YidC/Oxa1 family membrane protein insertase [Candidatus Paceibacterota bacterium]
MIKAIFSTIIYDPIYNALVLLLDLLPWADIGVVVIILTLIIKFILSPLSIKAVKTQLAVKEIEPDVKKIREKYKDDRETQAMKMMELYKEKGVKPFSGFLVLLLQIPIILGLYWVILKGGFPIVDESILYSFIPTPENINMVFLGLVTVSSGSIILALLTGVSQFFQMQLALPKDDDDKDDDSLKAGMMRSMKTQMRYIFPLFVAFFAYKLTAAIALYWITSNLFHIGQELYVRRYVKGGTPEEVPA